MYEQFFGLRRPPFDLTPNPEYLYLTASHREALSNLEYGVTARVGVTMLTGEAGMGKTTLIRATLGATRDDNVRAVYLNNPTLTRDEFVEFLARAFQLGAEAGASKTSLLFALERSLLESKERGLKPALIIDEAQSLPDELLEEVRLLANIETPTDKLLPIALVGQPELADRLNLSRWRQLKQRVGLRCALRPFELRDTAAYIATRIHVAGGQAAGLFTRDAVVMIHQHAQGIPRTTSVICANALMNGFALNQRPVGTEIVQEVCRDFDIERSSPPSLVESSRHAAESEPPALLSVPVPDQLTVEESPAEAVAGARRRFSWR
jgi:general secretion pathway protein A